MTHITTAATPPQLRDLSYPLSLYFPICNMASFPSSHSFCEDFTKHTEPSAGHTARHSGRWTHTGDLPVDLGSVLAL